MKFRTLIPAAVALIFSLSAFAQDEEERVGIDYTKIDVEVTLNPSHFRDQLQRYEAGDTTMRIDETAFVYYGYPSTFDYEPFSDYEEISKLYISRDYAAALPLIREALAIDPMNLDLIVMGAISASESSKPEDAEFLELMQIRFNMLVSTIMASGSGLDPHDPFKVIRRGDALVVLRNALGITDIVNSAEADNIMAYVFHLPQSQRQNVLYFDITPTLKFRK